jgi:exodeoxyribonuclease III
MLKISSWNIRQGGSLKRLPQIISAINGHNPDVCILSEYTNGEIGNWLKEQLYNLGYRYLSSSSPDEKTYGILLASKLPIDLLPVPSGPEEDKSRWTYVQIAGWKVLGVHIPLKRKQTPFWDALNRFAVANINEKLIIIGDYNTGLAEDTEFSPFTHMKKLQLLIDTGYIDGWRSFSSDSIEFTWYSNLNNGFRIDHCFLPAIYKNDILNCYYSHKEREEKVSDHSMLHVELK